MDIPCLKIWKKEWMLNIHHPLKLRMIYKKRSSQYFMAAYSLGFLWRYLLMFLREGEDTFKLHLKKININSFDFNYLEKVLCLCYWVDNEHSKDYIEISNI